MGKILLHVKILNSLFFLEISICDCGSWQKVKLNDEKIFIVVFVIGIIKAKWATDHQSDKQKGRRNVREEEEEMLRKKKKQALQAEMSAESKPVFFPKYLSLFSGQNYSSIIYTDYVTHFL